MCSLSFLVEALPIFSAWRGNTVVLIADSIARYLGGAVYKASAEKDVRMVEHARLQGDNDELRVRKVSADHVANILCVAEIQGRINLVQDVHRRWLEEQQGEDQRQCQKRPLSAAELRQRSFPDSIESDFDLKALRLIHSRRGLKFSVREGQQCPENCIKILVDLRPCLLKRLDLFLVEVFDDHLNFLLVVLNRLTFFKQVFVFLLCLFKHRHGLLVDALAQPALLSGKLAKPLLGLSVIIGLKIVICARFAKMRSVFFNPCVLLLHPLNCAARLLVLLLQLLQFKVESFLLEFFLFCNLLVVRQLLGKRAQVFVQISQLILHHLNFLVKILELAPSLHNQCLQLFNLSGHDVCALPHRVVTTFLCHQVILQHIKLNTGLLCFLTLLLQLAHLLLCLPL